MISKAEKTAKKINKCTSKFDRNFTSPLVQLQWIGLLQYSSESKTRKWSDLRFFFVSSISVLVIGTVSDYKSTVLGFSMKKAGGLIGFLPLFKSQNFLIKHLLTATHTTALLHVSECICICSFVTPEGYSITLFTNIFWFCNFFRGQMKGQTNFSREISF